MISMNKMPACGGGKNIVSFLSFILTWSLCIYLLVVHMDRDVWILLVFIVVVIAALYQSKKYIQQLALYKRLSLAKSDIIVHKEDFTGVILDPCDYCHNSIGKERHFRIQKTCSCLLHAECYKEFNARFKQEVCPHCQDEIFEMIEFKFCPIDV